MRRMVRTAARLWKRPSPPSTRVWPARSGQGVKHGLDEVLQVVRLLEDGDLLAQAGGPGALAGEGAGGEGLDAHERVGGWQERRIGHFISCACCAATVIERLRGEVLKGLWSQDLAGAGAPALRSRLPVLLHGGCNRGTSPFSVFAPAGAPTGRVLRLRFDVETREPALGHVGAPAGAKAAIAYPPRIPCPAAHPRLPALLQGGCNRGIIPDLLRAGRRSYKGGWESGYVSDSLRLPALHQEVAIGVRPHLLPPSQVFSVDCASAILMLSIVVKRPFALLERP